MALQTRIVMPASANKGQIIEIKTLVQHEMETGHRRDNEGRPIKRDIIHTFAVTYDGTEIFRADLFPGVAANPYFAFSTIATESGEVLFKWADDKGGVTTESRKTRSDVMHAERGRSIAVWVGAVVAITASVAPWEAWGADRPATPLSGRTFQSADTQRIEADEAANAGFLWLERGATLWKSPEGRNAKACASCHGDAGQSMKGVAASYPEVDKKSGALLNIEGRINQCRVERQGTSALAYESDALLALTAYVARQSYGLARRVDRRWRRGSVLSHRQGVLRNPTGPAQSRMRTVSRRQRRQAAARRSHQPGPDRRLARLPAGVADDGLAASPAQSLQSRRQGRDTGRRFARVSGARTLSRVARRGARGLVARRAAVRLPFDLIGSCISQSRRIATAKPSPTSCSL